MSSCGSARPRQQSEVADEPDSREPAQRWRERDIMTLLRDLGGCSAVDLEVPTASATAGMLPLLDVLTASPHLTLVHVCDHVVPPELRRRSAATVPWATVDPAIRRLRWAALGGRGDPPPATAVAELTAAATRQALVAAGFSGEEMAGVLP